MRRTADGGVAHGRLGYRRLRVLHLTREFPPVVWGGLGTALGGLARASARSGMDVAVLLVGHAAMTSYGVAVASLGAAAAPRLEQPGDVVLFQSSLEDAATSGIQLVSEWRPDVVHIHPVELWPVA